MNRHTYGQFVTTGQGAGVAPVSDLVRLETALALAGITPAKPLALVTGGMVKRTQTAAVSIGFTLAKGVKLPGAIYDMFEKGVWVDGERFVVQLKSA